MRAWAKPASVCFVVSAVIASGCSNEYDGCTLIDTRVFSQPFPTEDVQALLDSTANAELDSPLCQLTGSLTISVSEFPESIEYEQLSYEESYCDRPNEARLSLEADVDLEINDQTESFSGDLSMWIGDLRFISLSLEQSSGGLVSAVERLIGKRPDRASIRMNQDRPAGVLVIELEGNQCTLCDAPGC